MRLSAVIEELLAPYEEQLQQAGSMPGWQRRAAEDVLAETGPDMTRFPTPGHLASWAGRTPLDRQSGQRAGKARRKHGNRYIGAVTGQTSAAAGKTQTREGARHRRIARRCGPVKASVALGNTTRSPSPASPTLTEAARTRRPPDQPESFIRRHKPPPDAAACPLKVEFSGQKISGRLRSETATRNRYAIRGYSTPPASTTPTS